MKLIRTIRKNKRSARRSLGKGDDTDGDGCEEESLDSDDTGAQGSCMDKDMRETLYPGSTLGKRRTPDVVDPDEAGPSTSSSAMSKRKRVGRALSDDESGETDTDTEQRRLFKRNEKNIMDVLRDRLSDLLPNERKEQEELVSVVADALVTRINRPKNSPFPTVKETMAESGLFAKKLKETLKPPEPAVISGVWDSCMAPGMFELYETLGYPSPPEECWACNKDPENTVRSNMDAWECLWQIYRDYGPTGRMNKVQLAIQLHTYFEENIRKPANARLLPGQRPIPEWRKVDVFMHMYRHNDEPSLRINNIKFQVSRMIDDLHDYGLYKRNRAHKFMACPDSKPMHDYIDLVNLYIKVSSCKPENMIGARNNSERYSKSTAYNFINPDKSGYGGHGSHPSVLAKAVM